MDREKAIAFVEGYGRTWQAWDYEGFADLFTEDAIYVEHPTDETVVGRNQLLDYIRREHEAEGVASVSMGIPRSCGRARHWRVLDDHEQALVRSPL